MGRKGAVEGPWEGPAIGKRGVGEGAAEGAWALLGQLREGAGPDGREGQLCHNSSVSGILNHITEISLDTKSPRSPLALVQRLAIDKESSRLGRLDTPCPGA